MDAFGPGNCGVTLVVDHVSELSRKGEEFGGLSQCISRWLWVDDLCGFGCGRTTSELELVEQSSDGSGTVLAGDS